jgi:hypothetical protein
MGLSPRADTTQRGRSRPEDCLRSCAQLERAASTDGGRPPGGVVLLTQGLASSAVRAIGATAGKQFEADSLIWG